MPLNALYYFVNITFIILTSRCHFLTCQQHFQTSRPCQKGLSTCLVLYLSEKCQRIISTFRNTLIILYSICNWDKYCIDTAHTNFSSITVYIFNVDMNRSYAIITVLHVVIYLVYSWQKNNIKENDCNWRLKQNSLFHRFFFIFTTAYNHDFKVHFNAISR